MVIRTQVREVQVIFTVTDKHGRFVRGLGANQVRVLDNGSPVGGFTTFSEAHNLPLRIALLLDASDSMQPGFESERQAALSFLERIVRPEYDRAVVVSFANTEAPTASTSRPMLLEGAVRKIRSGGETALYDALADVSGHRLMTRREAGPVRRMVILLSDGEDNYSRINLDEAIAALQQSEIAVYAISVHSRRLEYPGDKVLRRLSEATGGHVFLLSNYQAAAKVFATIEEEVRQQYVLGYRPSDTYAGGTYHALQVIADPPHKRIVHARTGYMTR